MSDLKVPYLPENMPFNGEQKQWLGGFLAGLHTRLLVKEEGTTAQQAAAPAIKPLTIIYGSQTGNAQTVAEEAADLAAQYGLTASVVDMDDISLAELAKVERLLVVTSTYGEGEMPDNAQALWDAINEQDAPKFSNTFYSVLSLGDTNYDDFCLAGIQWDQRLEALGATRIVERVDCDIDFEDQASQWTAEVLPDIATKGSVVESVQPVKVKGATKPKSKYTRKNPLQAELITKKALTKAGSSKETFHYEFSLGDSGEVYEAGDALNVIPVNRTELVEELLALFDASGKEVIPYKGESLSLLHIFSEEVEIRIPSKEFIAELAIRSGDKQLSKLVNGETDQLNDFLWGKDTIDLLVLFPQAQFSVAEFINLTKPLAPRAYSISSSIKQHNNEVHLTIGNVRYHSNDRDHNGVCSTFLSDQAEIGDKVKCYFAPNSHFAVPTDPTAPMIMVGPGTGIAPFRAFLEERLATGAEGENWLIFGDRNSKTDFIYQEEIEAMQASGLIAKLDLAFSRDQQQKIYVQDRMLEHGEQLFAWLEKGGYFFICGDALYMAKDVEKALHSIIEMHGNMTPDEAVQYVAKLKKQKRYVRDVY
ncbi:sulfite reductase subunit alpha [Psychromonas sp. B3M02]|uniref:diflavin oxidoreductase n=1 Tax=Psychromonas sp. B3M02 TaxID=2267226 RepID=UPI000DEB9907|nr:sulfite reductase flavoprotein subunit alpha [Psychromonas sp. B3M02]RBW46137.1 sulfite reductase subunit alpha [Psychromonas sp. B3M02]